MNPLQEYNSIILNRQRNPLPEGQYGEKHHIIPKSCGGGNAEWNLVKLTPEEHYRVHELLPFIYTEGKEHRAMVQALFFMSSKHGVSVEDYGNLRREFSLAMSFIQKGKRKSDEMRRKLSESKKGVPSRLKGRKQSRELIEKRAKALKGRKPSDKCMQAARLSHQRNSEEWRRKISEANKGRIPWNKGKQKEGKI